MNKIISDNCSKDVEQIIIEKPERFFINREDDSMFPLIMEGDDIYFERTNNFSDGDVAVFLNTETLQTTVRKAKYQDGVLSLIARNQDYPVIKGESAENMMVCGKILWVGRKAVGF